MTIRALAALTGAATMLLLLALGFAATNRPTDEVLGSAASGLAVVTAAPVEPTATAVPTAVPTPTAAPTPTTVVIPTPEPTPTPRAVTISFSGDILSHRPVIDRARATGNSDLVYDYRPMFELVRPRLSTVDLALCVLETPLSTDNDDLSGYPSFNAPADLADALSHAGFGGCATASNHSLDRGERGVNETLNELDRVGLGHAGMARTSDEYDQPRIYEVNNVRLAHLSFTYGLNGYVRPAGKEWMVNVTDPALVLDAAARARAAGAELVILTIQWGNEYVTDPTEDQRSLADVFTASSDIDLIVGNHAHVVQPIDEVAGTTVIYGLGNFLSNQPAPGYPARTQDGMMVEVRFVEDNDSAMRVDGVTVIPTWVDKSTYTIVPVQAALEDPVLAERYGDVLATSLERTTTAVEGLGYPVTFE